LRIVSGTFRGRKLVAPEGLSTRPTLDRVREAMFNILMPCLHDGCVLDLFSGSGALALESLSRGAREAVLVDWDKAAQRAIMTNISALKVEDRCTLLRMPAREAISLLASQHRKFDLILLDPPYGPEPMNETLRICCEKATAAPPFFGRSAAVFFIGNV